MKVSNFNGNFLPNKQNKEQKSNSQNKVLTQNSMSFKGSAANDSLSAMGQAQVKMNKSNNISFKAGVGGISREIFINLEKGIRPEKLTTLGEEFERNIVNTWHSEQGFDKEIIDFMLDGDKRLNMDNVNKIYGLTYRKSRMNNPKFDDHVLPSSYDYTQYHEKHPIHAQNLKTLKSELTEKTIMNGAACAAGFGAMVVATGGLALLLGGVATEAAAAKQCLNVKQMEDKKAFYRANTVVPDLYSKCLDFKLKRMIAKGKIEAAEAAEVVRHYR
jgi:hypothetical protein